MKDDIKIEQTVTESKPERDSCHGCAHDLGGGCCGAHLEHECAAGGGYEAFQPKQPEKSNPENTEKKQARNDMAHACIEGILAEPISYSHTSFGRTFYRCAVNVARLSGTIDNVPIIIPGDLLAPININQTAPGVRMHVEGSLRVYPDAHADYLRTIVAVYACKLEIKGDEKPKICKDIDINSIRIVGTICRAPSYRITPFGREICDIMIAVRRGTYGKVDTIPCIAWGSAAKNASKMANGESISITGRFQSRIYEKQVEGEELRKLCAREISIFHLNPSDETEENPK